MIRTRLKVAVAPTQGNYFASEKRNLEFVSTGCTMLDCILGGGYVLGRITNVVGDRSTAKTALATEAITNFKIKHPDGIAAYRETEAAFDQDYAEAMGLPIDKVDFGDPDNPLITVEDFCKDFNTFLDARIAAKTPGIYVLDSLDSLSDEAEMKREVGEASYGMAKAKLLSEMFRKTTRKQEKARTALIVVSQVRDNIGAMFGEKHKRSGGRALDFYSSQIVWLSLTQTLTRTINKVKRPYGVSIKAKVKKNKVGISLREVGFDFIFGYGVEDLGASIEWLDSVGRWDKFEHKDECLKAVDTDSDADYRAALAKVTPYAKQMWSEVETTFLPKRRKYGNERGVPTITQPKEV